MGVTVNLDGELIASARSHSIVQSRSVPKQIEHWARIGRIAEENADLSYQAIQGILLGIEEARSGRVEEYHRGCL